MRHIQAIVIAVVLGLFWSPAMAEEVFVFAAASLTDVLKEIGAQYEYGSGDRITFNFAASSLLARQIEEGAPADLFFSADEEKMDWLEKKQLIVPETRKSIVGNALVIVIPSDGHLAIDSPRGLVDANRRIAIAEPQTVPAGIYAKEYLEKIGIWPRVVDRIVPTGNVRAALAAVESGNVDFGIVYKTDAAISHRVKVAFEVPMKDTPGISYPLAILRNSMHQEAARKFGEYLASGPALSVFRKYGFVAL